MTFGTTLVVRNWADQEKGHVYRKAKIYNRQIEKKKSEFLCVPLYSRTVTYRKKNILFWTADGVEWPVPVAVRSKVRACGRSLVVNAGSKPAGEGAWMFDSYDCWMLSGRDLCDELNTRPEEPYRLWCVAVCDLRTSWMRWPWSALGRKVIGTEKKKIPLKVRAKSSCNLF